MIDDWFEPTGELWAPVTTRIGDCTLTGHPGREEGDEWAVFGNVNDPQSGGSLVLHCQLHSYISIPPQKSCGGKQTRKNKWEGENAKATHIIKAVSCSFFFNYSGRLMIKLTIFEAEIGEELSSYGVGEGSDG